MTDEERGIIAYRVEDEFWALMDQGKRAEAIAYFDANREILEWIGYVRPTEGRTE